MNQIIGDTARVVDHAVPRSVGFGRELIVGVVSGIITGFLIYLWVKVWKQIVVPWYDSRVYRGLSVVGRWHLTDEGAREDGIEWAQVEVLELKQVAARVSGEQILVAKPGERTSSTKLRLSGTVRDRFVSLSLESADDRRLGIAVFLGEIVGDGNTIAGYAVYYDTLGRAIASVEVEYQRQSVGFPVKDTLRS